MCAEMPKKCRAGKREIAALLKKYAARKSEIEQRLLHFKKIQKSCCSSVSASSSKMRIGASSPKILFEELAFCILTPQSKAFSCDEAIRELKVKGLLFEGGIPQIRGVLSRKTRFHNKKAVYLVEAREKFEKGGFQYLKELTFSHTEHSSRALLLREVKGMGLKECSHYLRNVGRGDAVAILDRHILKNLAKYGAIRGLPKSLTAKRYLEIEKKMSSFCRKTGIPLSHLDLLFWAEETGKVFK